jgi:hypothetical protein
VSVSGTHEQSELSWGVKGVKHCTGLCANASVGGNSTNQVLAPVVLVLQSLSQASNGAPEEPKKKEIEVNCNSELNRKRSESIESASSFPATESCFLSQ